jgi:hypothetical protein
MWFVPAALAAVERLTANAKSAPLQWEVSMTNFH